MGADFHIRGDTKLDSSGFSKGIDKLGSVAKKGAATMQSSFQGATGALGQVAAKASSAASEIGKLGKDAGEADPYLAKLQSTLQETTSELDKLTQAYRQSVVEKGRFATETQELAAKIKEAERKQSELRSEIEKTSSFQQAADKAEEYATALSSVESEFRDVEKQTSAANSYIQSLRNTLEQTSETVDKLSYAYQKSVAETGKYSEKSQYLAAKLSDAKRRQSELQEEIEKASDSFEDAAKDVKKYSSSLSDLKGKVLSGLGNAAKVGFSTLVTAGAAAVGALGAAGVASVKLASDLTEVQNVVDVTFGKNADTINTWAKNAATSFGISELQAKKFNGTMGAMLKSMGLSDDAVLDMSTSMTGLAGDFASFYNLPIEEAFQKIRSGISGETEPLKELGINMSVANLEAYALSQGIDKSYNSMTQAEQAALRYNFLMAASADAQGDAARTNGTLAGQLRKAQLEVQNLSGAIGMSLLPMAQEMLGVGIDMLGQLKQGFEQGGVEGLISAATNVVGQLLNGFVTAAPSLIDAGVQILMMLLNGIATLIPTLPQQSQTIITALANGIFTLLPTLIVLGTQILFSLIQGFVSALPSIVESGTNAVLTLGDTIVNNLPQILESGTQLLLSLIQGIASSLPRLTLMGFELIFKLSFAIIQNLPQILDCGVQILAELIAGFLSMMGDWITLGSDLVQDMWNTITETDWLSLGANIISGIANGILNGAGAIVSAAQDAASRALNAAKNFLGIHSPSRVFRDEVGKMIPQGMAVGVETETDKAVRVTRQSAFEMLNAAKNTMISNQSRSPVLATAGAPAVSRQTAATVQTKHTTVIEMDGRTVAKVITPFVDQFLF